MYKSKTTLAKLTTKNYRNLLNEDGIALNDLNILIGPNGSGKSNVVAVLEFLKNCLTPTSDLESRGVTAFQDALSKLRYNILDASMKKPASVELAFKFPSLYIRGGIIFELSLNVIDKLMVFNNGERLVTPMPLSKEICYYRSHRYAYATRGAAVLVQEDSARDFARDIWAADIPTKEVRLTDIPTNDLALTTLPKRLTEYSPEQIPLYKASLELQDVVKKWQFYNANEMDLAKIRAASPKIGLNDIILAKSGENLPTVLDNLINHSQYGIDFEERVNNAMKEILPATRRLRTARSGMAVALQWYFDGMDEPFYLDDMSDGTVRMLCWATILHSPILPTLLVIDEPELSLHIAWMGVLANWLKQASQKTQIIITTHSPDLLDYFTDRAGDVICFEKTSPKGYFHAKKLPQAILQEKIAEGWQLGDLYRVGDDIIGGWPW